MRPRTSPYNDALEKAQIKREMAKAVMNKLVDKCEVCGRTSAQTRVWSFDGAYRCSQHFPDGYDVAELVASVGREPEPPKPVVRPECFGDWA